MKTMSVAARADAVGTFRHVEVFLMETLARWVPTTPEMEIKVIFGQHIWDLAQHADAFGRRTSELRAPLHYSRRPSDAYVRWLDELAVIEPSPDRMAAFYTVALPALDRRYREYLKRTDHLMDAPSVRILDRALVDFERMRREGEETRADLAALATPHSASITQLRDIERAIAQIVAPAATGEE